MPRPLGITILGILYLIGGVSSAIAAVMGAAMIGASHGMGLLGMASAGLGVVFLIIFGILAVIEFVIAGALFSGKPWGRKVIIILSIVSLVMGIISIVGNPASILVIILNAVVLWYMWRPQVIAYFGGTYKPQYPAPVEPKNPSLDILKERYARGEITKEEFDEKKKDLD